jgi:hypothetical protein
MVRMKETVDGPVTIKDSTRRGTKENSESVLGLASAWQHSSK